MQRKGIQGLIKLLIILPCIIESAPRVTNLLCPLPCTDLIDAQFLVRNFQFDIPLCHSVPRFAGNSGVILCDSPVCIDNDGNININGIIKNGNLFVWPLTQGAPGTFLENDGLGNLFWGTGGGSGSGNVSTSMSFTADNRLVRTDTVPGPTYVQQSGITVDDSNNISGVNSIDATTFVGNLTGSASNNVLKSGDSMTGTLNMLAQNEIRFQDVAGGQYVGIHAPAGVPTSYTLALPTGIPTSHQIMRANSTTPTQLEWATDGGAVVPTASKIIYVNKSGNDITGDGSFSNPYASLAKALSVANLIASAANPISIKISAGIYLENNSVGPLAITAAGIAIVGDSAITVFIRPSTLSNALLSVNNTTQFFGISFVVPAPLVSTAPGITMTSGFLSGFNNCRFLNFQTGVSAAGSGQSYFFNSCIFVNNGIGLSINNTTVACSNCIFSGAATIAGPAGNTGLSITGAGGALVFTGGSFGLCNIGLQISSNATGSVSSTDFRHNSFDIVQNTASQIILNGCSFEFTNSASDIDVQVSGTGTVAEIVGCDFNGNGALGTPEGVCIAVTDNGYVNISGGNISNYTTGIKVGNVTDASSTKLVASALAIRDCVTDILQQGTTTINFNAGSADSAKIVINDSTNVNLAFFDQDDNNALAIGSLADVDSILVQAAINVSNHLRIVHKKSLYSTQGLGFENPLFSPSTWFVESKEAARFAALTTDSAATSSLRLVSDIASPFGGTTALRGWDITKEGSSAELSFNFQNSDISLPLVPQYNLFQLDGFNNQVQLPAANTKIVFDGDTNLYRSAANVLKTDDNFIVGTLTPDRVVTTDPVTNELISSAVTNTELGTLSGITGDIQTQINGKVAKSGDSMTGPLELAPGSAGSPSLTFTGSTSTGLFLAAPDAFAISTAGSERVRISPTGVVTIDGLNTAGVVHNNASGNLSTSFIVNADVSPVAGIVDTKLATITTAGKVANSATTATSSNMANAIVARDASGNFLAGIITANLTGNATTATTATNFTGSLAGDVTGTQGATVVSTVGGQTAANVAAGTILANAATNLNTANTIVKRDGLGNFEAGTITADLLGNVTGSASNNVLKSGDSMTGTLNMLTQNEVRFEDAAGGQYIGMQAPAIVPASYTLALPTMVPTAHQTIRANGIMPTQLEWVSDGGSILPVANRTIYVTQYGNDTTGDGSFSAPYATLTKALDVANMIASSANPVSIQVSDGTYIEDNSAGPLAITTAGISITGSSMFGVIIIPNTLSNDLLLINDTTELSNLTFMALGTSTASALSFTASNFSVMTKLQFSNFQTGAQCQGLGSVYVFDECIFNVNGTAISINNTTVQCFNCGILGTASPVGPPANVGINATGSGTTLHINGGSYVLCEKCIVMSNNAQAAISAINFQFNANDIVQTSSVQMKLSGCNFFTNNDPSNIKIQISDPGSLIEIIGCTFNGLDSFGVPQGTAVVVSNAAQVNINSSAINDFITALQVGDMADTSSTQLLALALAIDNCTTDILQQGSSTLNFNAGTVDSAKIVINDSTNVSMAFFDVDDNALTIGSFADVDTTLVQAAISASDHLPINYKNSLYSTKGLGFENPVGSASTWFVESQDAASFAAITIDRAKAAMIRLMSDTASPFGGTTALRGWDIIKNGSTAELNFQYQNNDPILLGTALPYTVFQLDGENNEVQLPTANTKIVFDGDTNLYRSAANILKTDDNFIVGTLTPDRVITTDPITNQLTSSTVTNEELAYLSGVTSLVQTQLNGKVSKSGDTMTGALVLPSGSTALPSLTFTGNTTTGLSENANNLSFSTNAIERLRITSAGTISIKDVANGFGTPGIVHNDASGNLSSTLIVNSDVSPTAAIVDTKLATLSTAGKVANSATTATSANTASAIVSRDASGNFAAGTITANLTGNVTGSASNNVLKSGDMMTGTLVHPAGTAAAPSIQFSGSTNTGISAATANRLSFDTNGAERMSIGSTGTVAINGFTSTGIVHNDASGNLSTSLIVNSDITDATISNAKLATISSADTSGNIVVRDGSGNFATNMITIDGIVTNPTDVATKDYVDNAISTGLSAKTPAVVVSTTDIMLSGTQTIDSVSLVANDRVLLVGQMNPIENGLWLVQVGAWTRPADFATGSTAGQAYVLITSGATNAGSSWLCNTPLAIIDIDPIFFVQFSIPGQTTAANVGTGAGQLFKNKTGITLNFKTLSADQHVAITNNANEVNIGTDATSANTASTLVSRDASGNFAAGTITANLTGSASNNVLKSGDSMTGALNMLAQNEIRFQDAAGGEYVGLKAPTTVPASYTLTLPVDIPVANQTLRAGNVVPTDLVWVTEGGSIDPTFSRTIYVAKYGNDVSGNGSLDTPYATLFKAIDVANGIATASDPVVIVIDAGVYIEDNSGGPMTITAEGISIVGIAFNSVIIQPNTLSNDLLLINQTIQISQLTLLAPGVSTATGVVLTAGQSTNLSNVQIVNFQTGLSCSDSASIYALESCFFSLNGTGVVVSDTMVQCNNCVILGSDSLVGPPANTGLIATGAATRLNVAGGTCALCQTGFDINSDAVVTVNATNFQFNASDVIAVSSSQLTLTACLFSITSDASDIDIQIAGAGTVVEVVGCNFDGHDIMGVPQAVAIQVTDGAYASISSGNINNYTTGIEVGAVSDTSSTQLVSSAVAIRNCTTDILQQGSATLNFNAGTADSAKIIINDSTNVSMAFFDVDDNNALTIGSFADVDTTLVQAAISASDHLPINYKTSLYSTKGIGFENPVASASTWFVESQDAASFAAITIDRAKATSMRLVSDTAAPFGGTIALRGWDIIKNGTTGELNFQYQNNDLVGQSLVTPYTVLQLDGVNNQVQLPAVNTQIVFNSDTNLYRSAASVLKTDDNFIVGTLTPGCVVTTDSGTNQLVSSVTTNTELGYLSGVTSSVQTQLNGKVSKSGDVMTGALQLSAGTTVLPALIFTGSTTTGLSASSDNLSLSTGATERMKISSGGVVSINGFTTAGVVHNDASGNLSTSLIVNADVSPTAAIVDTKLATITTAGKVANSATTATSANTANAIVTRDASGNFSAGTITANLSGNATTATTATNFTGSLVGDVTGTQGATVVSSVDGQTAANVAAGAVLANAATNLNTPSAIVRRDASGNFAAGTITANLSGNATTATTATNFTGSLVGDVTGTQGATVVSSVGGQTAANVAAGTILANAATSANTASAIVRRDASGNFAAGTITASLNGSASNNVLKAGDIMTGALQIPAGTTALPTLKFTGSTTTGLSASSDNLSFSTGAIERMKISSGGTLSINGFTTAGVLHNDASGNLSTSLIVDADVDPAAAIVDTKLATISTAGKVANSATTATNVNTASAIVARDASGNFAAGTITANLTGNVTGSASLNVLKAGDTMTGTLVHPAGTAAVPSIQFTGSTNTGISAATANRLSFDTNGAERMSIGSTGIVAINGFSTAGVVHNDSSGNLSTSLIVNADVDPAAAIVDTKLATISTAGKVANSATTATNANTANAIVARDASGNFAAGTITANLNGNATSATTATTATTATNFTGSLAGDVTGTQGATVVSTVGGQTAANVAAGVVLANAATSANTANAIVRRDASGNFVTNQITINGTVTNPTDVATKAYVDSSVGGAFVLKAGDTMTGALQLPAGTAAAPSLKFTGSTNTGISAATANILSFDTSGAERMSISDTDITMLTRLLLTNLICNQAIQSVVPANNTSTTVNNNTSILLLKPNGAVNNNYTINFPSAPTNGQYLTIVLGSGNAVQGVTMALAAPLPAGATIVNPITNLTPGSAFAATTGGVSVTYIYYSTDNAWYRINRG